MRADDLGGWTCTEITREFSAIFIQISRPLEYFPGSGVRKLEGKMARTRERLHVENKRGIAARP